MPGLPAPQPHTFPALYIPGIQRVGCIIQPSLWRCRMSHSELRAFFLSFSRVASEVFAAFLRPCCFLEDLECLVGSPEVPSLQSTVFSSRNRDENVKKRAISRRLKSRKRRVNMGQIIPIISPPDFCIKLFFLWRQTDASCQSTCAHNFYNIYQMKTSQN